jgi:hypothetical protein
MMNVSIMDCYCLFILSISLHTGDLYFQARSFFDADMYLRLTSILHTTIRNSKGSDDFENEVVCWFVDIGFIENSDQSLVN